MPNTPKQKPTPDVKRNGTGRIRMSASMKPGMDKHLEMIAIEDGMNKSQVIQQLIAKEIKRRRRSKSSD